MVKDFPRLGAGRDFQFLIAIQSGDFHFRAESSLGNIDIQVQNNIVLAALEELMRFDIQHQEQTSIGPPKAPGPPSPARRICVPASTPAGICTFFLTVLRSRPPP